MTDLRSPSWSIVDTVVGDVEEVHFGLCRVAGRFVFLHESEARKPRGPGCCGGAVTVLRLETVTSIMMYSSWENMDEAVAKAGIHRMRDERPPLGPEVR